MEGVVADIQDSGKRRAIGVGGQDAAPVKDEAVALVDLPDEVLGRVLTFVTVRGKVCRRWEHVKLMLARERCVQVLMKNASLGEALSRDVEQELFGVSNSKIGLEYKNGLRRIIFNVRPNCKNPSVREQLLSGKVTARAFVRLTPEELASKEERDHAAATTRETVKKLSSLPCDLGKVESRLFECPRCQCDRTWVRKWRRGTSANQVDRIKLIITCVECNNTWNE